MLPDQERQAHLKDWRNRQALPDSGFGFLRLADLLVADNQGDEALALLEGEVAKGSACPGALLKLGELLFARGRDIEARSHLMRLLVDDPGNTAALAVLANRAVASESWEEAGRLFGRLCELEPDQELWARSLARAQAARKSSAAPRDLAAGAGRPPRSTLTLVDIYLAQGYTDKALAILRELSLAQPDRLDVLERLAELESGLAHGGQVATSATDSIPGSTAAPEDIEERLSAARKDAARKRQEEKQMFRSWVNNLRRGGE